MIDAIIAELQPLLGDHLHIDEILIHTPGREIQISFTLWGHPTLTDHDPPKLAEEARQRIEQSPDWVLSEDLEYTLRREIVTSARYIGGGELLHRPRLRWHIHGTMGLRPVPLGRTPTEQTANPHNPDTP